MQNTDDPDYFQVIHTGNALVWPGVESGVFGLVSSSTRVASGPLPPPPPGSGSADASFGLLASRRVKEALRVHASKRPSDDSSTAGSLVGAVMATHRTVTVGDAITDRRYFAAIDGHCAADTALLLVSFQL